MRAALQLQMIAPSSLLSHSGPDVQRSEFFISLQLPAPMQAHLRPSPGVSKQLNAAQASKLPTSDTNRKSQNEKDYSHLVLHLS